MKYLIVNADDFGQSPGVNRGVALCHDAGILTSASLMVRWPAAREAADYAAAHPALAVGLHVDLGEWACEGDRWFPLYDVVPLDDGRAVRGEVERQLTVFRTLMGGDPTHLDSHQHAHEEALVREVLLELAAGLGIPLRGCSPAVRYAGGFYGQGKNGQPVHDAISIERLLGMLRTLPDGITELGCHPAVGRDLRSVYLDERAQEVTVLCDARVKAAIRDHGITLVSFRDVADVHGRR
jgi:predicted glycoside hydrolase/deacetylase ChbG (UPF0249 family)